MKICQGDLVFQVRLLIPDVSRTFPNHLSALIITFQTRACWIEAHLIGFSNATMMGIPAAYPADGEKSPLSRCGFVCSGIRDLVSCPATRAGPQQIPG